MATINGTSGNDSLVGTAGIDTINGLDGDDTLVGGGGYDFFSGGLGNDSIVAGVNGGDWAFYDSNIGGINANLATGLVTGALGNDTLIGIDDLSGTNFADSITGSSGNNSIQGRGGDDTLIGGGGIDTADYNNATGPVTVSRCTYNV